MCTDDVEATILALVSLEIAWAVKSNILADDVLLEMQPLARLLHLATQLGFLLQHREASVIGPVAQSRRTDRQHCITHPSVSASTASSMM